MRALTPLEARESLKAMVRRMAQELGINP